MRVRTAFIVSPDGIGQYPPMPERLPLGINSHVMIVQHDPDALSFVARLSGMAAILDSAGGPDAVGPRLEQRFGQSVGRV